MAEVRKLKGKRTGAQQRLNISLATLETAMNEDNGRTPTEQALTRQQAGLETAWGTFEAAHTLYIEALEDEAAEAEAQVCQDLFALDLGQGEQKIWRGGQF